MEKSKKLTFDDIQQIIINDLNGDLLVNIFTDKDNEVKIMYSDLISLEVIRKD